MLRERSRMMRAGLDHALESVAGIAKLAGRTITIDDARLAVKATDMACGPAARAAEAWLLGAGLKGIVFHSLKGHYVLRDEVTALLHDIETPQGCASREELPIWRRSVELAALSEASRSAEAGREAVEEAYARAWLANRLSDEASVVVDQLVR